LKKGLQFGLHALITSANVALTLTVALPAQAQPFSISGTAADTPVKVFTFLATASVSEDSNIFRQPARIAQAETITTGSIGIRLDKPYGQQHFQLEANQSKTSYDRFKYLDFDALNYNGSWFWKSGTRLSGKVTASRAESLAPFQDTLGVGRNVRISQNQAVELDAWMFGGWHLLVGANQSDQKSQQATLINRTPDFRSTSGNAGIKFESRAGNSITVRRTETSGEYLNNPLATQNTDYTEQITETLGEWRFSGYSAISARVGWLDRKNADVTRRNFSGPSSNVSYSWSSGGDFSFTASANRATSPVQDLTSSYREETTFSLAPTWRISGKTSSSLSISSTTGTDKGPSAIPGAQQRKDTSTAATLGINWTATRTVSVNASVQRLQRDSTLAVANYDATIARVGASLAF